jgi:hypothetical protein
VLTRRQRFLERVNAAYATLRSDQKVWKAVEAERRTWDATLSDGLSAAERRAPYSTRTRPKRSPKRR